MSLSNRNSIGVGRVGAFAQALPTVDQQVIRHVQELQAKTLRLQQEAYELVKETETLREAERQLSSDLDSIKIEVNSAGVRAADSQARNDVLIGSKESLEFILSSNRVLAQRARQDISEREAHLKAVRKLYIKTLDGVRCDLVKQTAATTAPALEAALGRAMQRASLASAALATDRFAPREAELADLRAQACALTKEIDSVVPPSVKTSSSEAPSAGAALPSTPQELAFVLDPWGCAAGSSSDPMQARAPAAALSRLRSRMALGSSSPGAVASHVVAPELPELSAVSLFQYATFRLAQATLVRDLLWQLDARLQARFPLSAASDAAAAATPTTVDSDEWGENADLANSGAGEPTRAVTQTSAAPSKASACAHSTSLGRALCVGEISDPAGLISACDLHLAEAFMSLAENAYRSAEDALMALSAALESVLGAKTTTETVGAPGAMAEEELAVVESDGDADDAATQIVVMADDE